MSSMFRQPLIGYHLADGTWLNSRWVEGAETSFTFDASVQATTPHDVMYLEEGRRMRKMYTLYTDNELVTLVTSKNPDRVVIDNEKYEVDVSAPWQNNVINHHKYIVTKMQAIEV